MAVTADSGSQLASTAVVQAQEPKAPKATTGAGAANVAANASIGRTDNSTKADAAVGANASLNAEVAKTVEPSTSDAKHGADLKADLDANANSSNDDSSVDESNDDSSNDESSTTDSSNDDSVNVTSGLTVGVNKN